jgi:hypothetical protein
MSALPPPLRPHAGRAPVGHHSRHARGDFVRNADDGALRRRLVPLAVVPAGLVALVGAALTGFIAYQVNGFARPVLIAAAAAAGLTVIVVLVAGRTAARHARAVTSRTAELARIVATLQTELAQARGELAQRLNAVPVPPERPSPVERPELPQLPGPADHREQIEIFVNLAHRLQSLVHREIALLDELENNVEDPDLLKGIFQVDHLATRVRRYAENLAVLGGAIAERQWTRPVSLTDVLRSAVAEVEQYSRVKLVPPVPGTVRGHAVVDVVHLLAELAENATMFSPPQTRVLLRAEKVTAGLAIEVEDRGLGMEAAERAELNALLASPERVIPSELLRDGRIGIYVVSVLARRHGITVQLQGNIYGGTQAVLVLPSDVLGEPAPVTAPDPPDPHELPQRTRSAGPAPRLDSAARAATAAPPVAAGPATATIEMPQVAARAAEPEPVNPRPSLPLRRRQQHLAPELRQPPPGPEPADAPEHTPGLMAAFQAGVRRAETLGDLPASPGSGDTPSWGDPQ